MTIELISLNVGKPKHHEYEAKTFYTGIFKQPVTGPVYLSKTQLAGDGQGDLVHHGGPDKAVNVYSYEHYAFWEQKFGVPLPLSAFGENLTVKGLMEENVCIGNIYALGDAVVQVAQPRIPCVKINVRFGRNDVLDLVRKTGYTGFYLRVLEEGTVDEARTMKLLEQHPKGLTVDKLNRLLHHDRNIEGMQDAMETPELAAVWKKIFTEWIELLQGKK